MSKLTKKSDSLSPLQAGVIFLSCDDEHTDMPEKARSIEEARATAEAKEIREALKNGTTSPILPTKKFPNANNRFKAIQGAWGDLQKLQQQLDRFPVDTFLSNEVDTIERIAIMDKIAKVERDLFYLIYGKRARTAMLQLGFPTIERFYPYMTEKEIWKIANVSPKEAKRLAKKYKS
jgi:hypothetical protein